MKIARLILEDGSQFVGWSFGYDTNTAGEVVFNTAMTGYPESLTDPSYAGQILVTTYPLIGNYGVPDTGLGKNGLPLFMESEKIHAKALVVADYSETYSHWNAKESLASWLRREKIPAITGIDTRRLTKVLRESGVMMGRIEIGGSGEFAIRQDGEANLKFLRPDGSKRPEVERATHNSRITNSTELNSAERVSQVHPELQVARYQMQASKHEWHQARASLYPSLSLGAGLSTTFYRSLHSDVAASFSNQFKNNMGEYVGATLSIPLFNRLQTITSIRRAKNNYQIAREAYEQKQLELEKLSCEAWQDWQGYLKQTVQMVEKVEADSISYQLTRRQFEEGLSTAIDLHTTSTQLMKSKATLLQCQLMAMVKEQLVRYYKGEQIWIE